MTAQASKTSVESAAKAPLLEFDVLLLATSDLLAR
jgi:hypothetical protein